MRNYKHPWFNDAVPNTMERDLALVRGEQPREPVPPALDPAACVKPRVTIHRGRAGTEYVFFVGRVKVAEITDYGSGALLFYEERAGNTVPDSNDFPSVNAAATALMEALNA